MSYGYDSNDYHTIATFSGAIANGLAGGFTGIFATLEQSNYWTIRMQMIKYEVYIMVLVLILMILSIICESIYILDGGSADVSLVFYLTELSTGLTTIIPRFISKMKYRSVLSYSWMSVSRSTRLYDEMDALKSSSVLQEKVKITESSDIQFFSFSITADPSHFIAMYDQSKHLTDETTWVKYYPVIKASVSILWGGYNDSKFAPRCSRAITSLKKSAVSSSLSIIDFDIHDWIMLAHSVLARNKGPSPAILLFGRLSQDNQRNSELKSTWKPRPSKTQFSQVFKEMDICYGRISEQFCIAASTFAVIFADMSFDAIQDILFRQLEHQGIEFAWCIDNSISHLLVEQRDEINVQLYSVQYISFYIVCNYYFKGIIRPDGLCLFCLNSDPRIFSEEVPVVKDVIIEEIMQFKSSLLCNIRRCVVQDILELVGSSRRLDDVLGEIESYIGILLNPLHTPDQR
jgi:hypothetical protein